MKESTSHNTSITPNDYLTASLFDYFRDPKNSRNVFHAAKLAQTILVRDVPHKANIEKRFIFFAAKLKNDVTATTLRDFAEKCFAIALKAGFCLKSSSTNEQTTSIRTLKKRAKEDLSISLKLGHSEGAAVNRAAYELVRTRKAEMAKHRLTETIRAHPLRETLEGLMVNDTRLAKEDIRNQFLRLKRPSFHRSNGDGVLYGLLAKAQAFSAPRLHRLLGDELFFLCRPCGFLDQKETTVVIEVPTSAHLHALTYRKLEILRALKEDTAFLLVNKLHFKVKTTSL